MPFEAEVGSHPTLEEMQNVVVHQRKRPVFKNEWGKHLVSMLVNRRVSIVKD